MLRTTFTALWTLFGKVDWESNYKKSFCKENIKIELCLPPKSNQPMCTWKTSVSQLFLHAWQNVNAFSITKFCVLLSTTYLWRSGSWTLAQNRHIFYLLVTFCCLGSNFSFIFYCTHLNQKWTKKGPCSVKIRIKLSDRLIWRLQLWAKSRNPFTPSSAATQGGSFFFSIISFNLWLEDFSLMKMFSEFPSFWLWWITVKHVGECMSEDLERVLITN